jgi:hypothetical protein
MANEIYKSQIDKKRIGYLLDYLGMRKELTDLLESGELDNYGNMRESPEKKLEKAITMSLDKWNRGGPPVLLRYTRWNKPWSEYRRSDLQKARESFFEYFFPKGEYKSIAEIANEKEENRMTIDNRIKYTLELLKQFNKEDIFYNCLDD